MAESAALAASVAANLQSYIALVREKNQATIQQLIDQGDEDDILFSFNEPDDFLYTPDELLTCYDELDEKFDLSGVDPRIPREYSSDFLEPSWSTELKSEVRQGARHGFGEDLELPQGLKILFSMVDCLTGSGLPKHRSNAESELHGGVNGTNAELPSEVDDPLDTVVAYDDAGDVEIAAGWRIGNMDSDGYIPWAIWCRVVDSMDKSKVIKPWDWRYVTCTIESGGKLLDGLGDLLEFWARRNPEDV